MARTAHNRRLGCRSGAGRDQSAWASSDTPLHPTTTNSAAPDHGATCAHTHQQGRPMTSGRLLRVRHRGCDRRAYGDTPLQTRVVPIMGATYRRQAPGIRTRGVRRIPGRL